MAAQSPTFLIILLLTVSLGVCGIGVSCIWEAVERAHNARDCVINSTRINAEGGARGTVNYVVYLQTVTTQDESVELKAASFQRREDADLFEWRVNNGTLNTIMPCWVSKNIGGVYSGTKDRPDLFSAFLVGGIFIAISIGMVIMTFFYMPNLNWKAVEDTFNETTALLREKKWTYGADSKMV
eukprot:TRINITY_DN3634_c0_g1_i1.p1 TRINITY_DN3634_c0_g1~~TRINITY_DN3634_c0_g1_i1.p1  ORF type:complete len:183 (-),score=19.84 TRINITY_DN3634_c0_g1_i1:108-656(-)